MKLRFIFGRKWRAFNFKDIVGTYPRISENQMKRSETIKMKNSKKVWFFAYFDYFSVSFAILFASIFPEFQENLKNTEKHENEEIHEIS